MQPRVVAAAHVGPGQQRQILGHILSAPAGQAVDGLAQHDRVLAVADALEHLPALGLELGALAVADDVRREQHEERIRRG